jgi:succinoglycan biosynthesis protein ExoV
MILYRWQGAARNFGDELNTLLWPRLLPGFFDDDPASLFLGIGSILDGRHSGSGLKLVAGSGYGGYERRARLDASWVIHWVRGPRTASILGLPAELGVGDPAVLLPLAGETRVDGNTIGFMPHFESASFGAWHAAAAAAGIRLIDPRDDPRAVIAAIRGCRVLLSEALHGVIVADALRVPWVAIKPLAPIHRAKWHDWAATLGVRLVFRHLPPSSLLEWARSSSLAEFHAGRTLLSRHTDRLHDLRASWFLARATTALAEIARAMPQLSAPQALERCQSRMMDRLAALRRDRLTPPAWPQPVQVMTTQGRVSHLRAYDASPTKVARIG